MAALWDKLGLGPDDGAFFAAGKADQAAKLAGQARTRVGVDMWLIDQVAFRLCWIIDFQLYFCDEDA